MVVPPGGVEKVGHGYTTRNLLLSNIIKTSSKFQRLLGKVVLSNFKKNPQRQNPLSDLT